MTTPITVVFDPPLPSDTEEVFDEKAFDSLAKMNTWSSQANAITAEINASAANAAVQAVGADLAGANTIGAVAAIDAEVAAVAAVDTEVVVVAGVAANVTTVAGIAANVTTVAGNSANVTTVASNIAAVNTAAADIAAIIAAPGAASTASGAAGVAVAAKDDAEDAAAAAAASAASIAGGPVTSVNGQHGVVVLDADDVGAEPAITAGTTAQYRRGDKSWRDFATDVRAAVLTGLSTASAVAVAAADSVLVAIGKLQAQINNKMAQVTPGTSGNVLTSNGGAWVSSAPSAATGTGTGGYLDVAASRSNNTVYTNTGDTTRWVIVNPTFTAGSASWSCDVYVNGNVIFSTSEARNATFGTWPQLVFPVPPGGTYKVVAGTGFAAYYRWMEYQ